MVRRLLPLFLLVGCVNARIDDGARYGPFTQVKTFFTSAFVAQTSEGVVLIDSGYSKKGGPIDKHLQDQGLDLSDVAHVFVTHGHSDHVRGLDAYPKARIWAHPAEVALIREEGPDGIEVDETVEDGDIVTIGELDIEVFHVPGHTKGNLTLLSEGVLLTGDTAMSFKDGTVGPAPEKYADKPTQAEDQLLLLRDRLLDRRDEIDAVVFAHSEGLRDTAPFWDMR